tara:strand:+ start:1841 stop:1999 length:159 start_codon:yes stop_codon:yes gene_type:complete
VSSYLTVSPLPNGGLLSVALSVKLPCPAVSRHSNPMVLRLSSFFKKATARLP